MAAQAGLSFTWSKTPKTGFLVTRLLKEAWKKRVASFSMGEWTLGFFAIKLINKLTYEPPHDKTNKMTMHPVKTRISLGIHPVWSESSLWAHWVAKNPSFLHADSKDSYQIGQMPRHTSFCLFCHEATQYWQMVRKYNTDLPYLKFFL